jgi:hypothetical protein
MIKRTMLSVLFVSALLGCGGGNTPPADTGVPATDTGVAADTGAGPTCAAPGFVCCLTGSSSAQQPSCENDVPVCPESNPPYVRTPGTTCSSGSDASTD